MHYQQRLGGGEDLVTAERKTHDMGLSDRIARRDANRARLAGAGGGRMRSLFGEDTSLGKQFGIRKTKQEIPLDLHDKPTWRLFGNVAEVPLHGQDAPVSIQGYVNMDRVQALADNPALGSNPRFPWTELPHAIEDTQGRTVIYNGNHRTAGAVHRGELFTPMSVIHPAQMRNVMNYQHGQIEKYGDQYSDEDAVRGKRTMIGEERITSGDWRTGHRYYSKGPGQGS